MSIQTHDENLRQSIIDSDYDFNVIEEASENIKNRLVYLFCLAEECRGTEHEDMVNKLIDNAMGVSRFVSNAMLVNSMRRVGGVVYA